MFTPGKLWGSCVLVLLLGGCGAPKSADERTCVGKCDGVLNNKFVDLFRHPDKLGPGDLTKLSADLVTGEINNLLEKVPFFQPRLKKTEVYALRETADQHFVYRSLEGLTAGLTNAYGENDFFTRVNRLRKQHLERNPGQVWAEASFQLPNDPTLSFSTAGLDGQDVSLSFGFTNLQHDVYATVIAPYPAESSAQMARALVDAPADAVMTALGGLPNTLGDFRAMVPGQMIALRTDEGVAGFRFNGAMPVYITSVSEATLWARISAAAAVIATAEMDVQMIRTDDDQVVVDVGLTQNGDSEEPNMQFGLAVDGYWGVDALMGEKIIDIGPFKIDVAEIARKTVRKQLNKYLQPFRGWINWNPQVKTRNTIARFAFDLRAERYNGRQVAEMERALNLASHGMMFYAQYLATQPGSGVTQPLGVDRLARTPSFDLGLELPVLGMNFHYERQKNIGDATLTIGTTTKNLFWNRVAQSKGWFWTKQKYQVTGVSSVTSENGVPVNADHNLRLVLIEKQGNALRDDILDHADAMLMALIGKQEFNHLETYTDAIEREVNSSAGCPHVYDDTAAEKLARNECMKRRPYDPDVATYAGYARIVLENAIAGGHLRGGLDPAFDSARDIARQLLELKIAAQSLPQDRMEWGAPEANLRVQYNLTANAIREIFAHPQADERFSKALTDVVGQFNVNRTSKRGEHCWDANAHEDNAPFNNQPQMVCSNNPPLHEGEIADVVKAFNKQRQRYLRLQALSKLPFPDRDKGALVTMGDHGIVVEVDAQGRMIEPDPEAETQQALAMAERKAATLTKVFESMVDEAEPFMPVIGQLFDGLGETEHQILGYTLMSLAHPSELELLISADFSDEPEVDGKKPVRLPDLKLYGRGRDAKLVNAGQFDLEALIGK